LEARIERLLSRPLIAKIPAKPANQPAPQDLGFDGANDAWQAMARRAEGSLRSRVAHNPSVQQDGDGAWCVPIQIDYQDLWRGKEGEVKRQLEASKENLVVFLTPDQEAMLKRTPREFLALRPRPLAVELLDFTSDHEGRAVGIIVAAPPEDGLHGSVAIIPNLVQLQRQLDALAILTQPGMHPALAPLRALVGLGDLAPGPMREGGPACDAGQGTLDEQQRDAVHKALRTPHFSVIHGPPGSGKTTVIAEIVRESVRKGERVLIVSPTHLAVDNIVEKLARVPETGADTLIPHTLPVRFASRRSAVSKGAEPYWVGPRNGARDATLVRRLHGILRKACPEVASLPDARLASLVLAPELSKALCNLNPVICGTPIGILSNPHVKEAQPGAFDLLVVDEVSKMLLPEFLAVAVKARRWVLVGDPEQLPPFLDAVEAAVAFDETLSPMTELVCSVSAILEKERPSTRAGLRLIAVTDEPGRAVEAIRAHLAETGMHNLPEITQAGDAGPRGVVVCNQEQVPEVFARLHPAARADRGHHPDNVGGVRLLVRRGLAVPRPSVGGGLRFVEERDRAVARMLECAFNCYHSLPWSRENQVKLEQAGFRKGLAKMLPSLATVLSDHPGMGAGEAEAERARLVRAIAQLYAAGSVSVYDWLVGLPSQHFDAPPLLQLRDLNRADMAAAVRPHCGKLTMQYRMKGVLSEVPRALFYGGRALVDGSPSQAHGGRVDLFQVDGDGAGAKESNKAEAHFIIERLADLAEFASNEPSSRVVMVITPYLEQMDLLVDWVGVARRAGRLDGLEVECMTIDRCQGREADYVFVSLVRSQATHFMDSPKRWNVALTRARQGLALVGDIKAYEGAARKARSEAHPAGEVRMRLLARIIEAYQRQNEQARRRAA
jgi:hypothetical protein